MTDHDPTEDLEIPPVPFPDIEDMELEDASDAPATDEAGNTIPEENHG